MRKTPEGTIAGEIVETEAYVGPDDKASHAYRNKRTHRTFVQFGDRAVAYVYSIYGAQYCFCIVVGPRYIPAVTLIRAIRPVAGIGLMRRNRGLGADVAAKKLADGPSKMCKAFEITDELNGLSLLSDDLFLCRGTRSAFKIGQSARIGIDYAEEYRDIQWRFFVKNRGR